MSRDLYQFPMQLRYAMDRAATVLKNLADSRNREFDGDSQAVMRNVLDDLDAVCEEANMAGRRTAPVSAPMGQELPSPWQERVDLRRYPNDRRALMGLHYADQEIAELRAIVVPYAERIRQLERELAEHASIDGQLIGAPSAVKQEGPAAWVYECLQPGGLGIWAEFFSRDKPPEVNFIRNARPLAYIDGRTAGTAWVSVNDRLPVDCAYVAIFDPDNEAIKVRTSQWLAGSCTFESEMGWLAMEEVSHWMPLPAAPTPMNSGKEEGND